jgi:heat shock protein HslJ
LAAVASIVTLAFGAALAGCTMPTHPDSAAPPTDPYNPAATQLLDDTQWQLTSWANADGKTRPVPSNPAGAAAGSAGGAPITLNFSTQGGQRKTNGFSGCNRFAGTYDLAGGELSFGPLASTRMACAPGPGSALEQPFLQGLADIERTGVQMQPPQQLQITLKNGDVMTFTQGAQP